MSSSSDSEQYTSSEEFIRTKNYKTKSGRTSCTRYRKEFSDSDSDSNNFQSNSSSDSSSTSDSEAMAALNLTAKQISNLLKTFFQTNFLVLEGEHENAIPCLMKQLVLVRI